MRARSAIAFRVFCNGCSLSGQWNMKQWNMRQWDMQIAKHETMEHADSET
jgi:hypothetical protein